MDDDLDFPEDSGKGGSGLLSDLFGDTKKKPTRRSNLDDILSGGSSSQRRKPTVTFQESSLAPSKPSVDPNPKSSFDSLFDSEPPRRRQPSRESREQVEQRAPETRAARREPPREDVDSYSSRNVSADNQEFERLKKEISTLRYEKNEDQQTISELRRKLDNVNEDHKREIRELEDRHMRELDELKRTHNREIEILKYNNEQDTEVLMQLRRQSNNLEAFTSQFDTVNSLLGSLQQEIRSINTGQEEIDRVLKFANDQILLSLQRLKEEKDNFENKKVHEIEIIEKELENMYRKYNEEIISGRKWMEAEKLKLTAEKLAFQEEQAEIFEYLQSKRQELEEHKSEFITKEHDLLVRVVNERNLLEQMKNEFAQQRNSDIMRIREEAEHLERCLIQIDNAYQGLERARKDYEQRNLQLNEIKQTLIEYEKSLWNNYTKA